jgi:hypothetical protein
VSNVLLSPNATHDTLLLSLHTCGFAIIDISHPRGQFVEIDRMRDYGIPKKNVLLLPQSSRLIKPKKRPYISQTLSFHFSTYLRALPKIDS